MEIDFSFITLIALATALLLQPLRRFADRQAHLNYRERVGEKYASSTPEHRWLEDRHLVGRWGCLYIVLQVLQGIAGFMAIGGVVYWWLL